MTLSKELLHDCLGLGFVASHFGGLHEFALGIFRMARELEPSSSSWVIGTGMVYANSEGGDSACQYMNKEGVELEKGDLMARAFFGLFSMMAKQTSQGERILKGVIEDGSDVAAVKLAKNILANES